MNGDDQKFRRVPTSDLFSQRRLEWAPENFTMCELKIGRQYMTMTESAVRSLAKRKGFWVRKSRTRNPDSPDCGGFMLVNGGSHVVLGAVGHQFSETLDDIADWLTDPACAKLRQWHGGR